MEALNRLAGLIRDLRGRARERWANRRYKRWQDLPISASFVLYTLAAFLAGTLVCLIVITLCNKVRIDLQNKYAERSVSYEVPEQGSYDIRRTGRLVTVTIYDEDDQEIDQFTVNLRTESLAYDAEIRASYRGGEPEGGLYMGSYYGSHGFVVTPRYTGEDSVANITAVTVSVLIVPVSYIGALIMCAALFFRRKLRGPLALLKNSSDRIARNDLDFTVAYDSKNELGQVCDSFETMRHALVQNNRELWRSVEERKRLNAAFSHDLRTPLTVLKGHASMLLAGVPEGSVSQEEIVGELTAMSGSIDRMERYVDAMARLQRLEDVEVRRRSVDFGELTEALRDSAQVLCGDKKLYFEAIPGGPAKVSPEIVQQVCENLLTNGARYAATELRVRVWTEPDRLLVRVCDDGPGFSAVDLEKATDPFYRNKAAAGDDHLGLGLNICKILCQRHDGDIRLENDGGGCVTVSFGF